MAKKSKLNGFVFKKLDEISNGLQIPTGNAIKQPPSIVESPPQSVYVPPVRKESKPISKPRIAPFHKLVIDGNSFKPMINSVPTIQPVNVPTQEPKFKGLSRKQKQRILPEDLNMGEYGALSTKPEKITYLAMRGWSLKEEMRGNTFYHYATRYVNRKKKRLYLGSVNEC